MCIFVFNRTFSALWDATSTRHKSQDSGGRQARGSVRWVLPGEGGADKPCTRGGRGREARRRHTKENRVGGFAYPVRQHKNELGDGEEEGR